MKNKVYYKTAATIFSVVAIVHFFRVIEGWEAVLGEYVIPVWFSWVAVAIAGYMAVRGFMLSSKK